MSGKPLEEPGWGGSVNASEGVGFPIVMVDAGAALNAAADEKYVHVGWTPADVSRTGGAAKTVRIGRFSTIGATFKTAAAQPAPEARPDTPIASGTRQLNIKVKSDATVVQRRLIELGYLKGKADGAFGKGSRAALAKFRDDAGLGIDGDWDLETQQAAAAGDGMADADRTVWSACVVNCGSRCPIRLQIKDGTVERVLPDNTGDDSLFNRQIRACVRGRNMRQRIYNPDRIKTPLKRRDGTETTRPRSASARQAATTRSASSHNGPGIDDPLMPARSWNSVRTQPGSRPVTVTPVPRSSSCSAVE